MVERARDAPVFVAARFANGELAATASDRLRRYQARQAGKIRLLMPTGREEPTVVGGPIRGLDLDEALRIIAELEGQLVSAVRPT